MRTPPAENAEIGEWMAKRLNQCPGPVHLLLPEGGVSMLDAPGEIFWDPAADAALFAALESHLHPTPNRRITKVPHHINHPAFAAAAVTAFRSLM